MKKEDLSPQQYEKIMNCFIESLVKNGLKGTTMDAMASSLQMSKRSLYELFRTKDDLFLEAHEYFHKKNENKLSQILNSSSNVMEGIIKCCLYNRDMMSDFSAEFIHDMEEFATARQVKPDDISHPIHNSLYEVIQRGVDEGYFRDDINLRVQCRMLVLQMSALKHIEKLFPEDITLLDAYDSISLGFLRGISTAKGLTELEKYFPLSKDNEK